MPKRRAPKSVEQEIESFGDDADKVPNELGPDPKAPRGYKSISVPFNEYEFRQLERVAEKQGRSKLNLIRWAIAQLDSD